MPRAYTSLIFALEHTLAPVTATTPYYSGFHTVISHTVYTLEQILILNDLNDALYTIHYALYCVVYELYKVILSFNIGV